MLRSLVGSEMCIRDRVEVMLYAELCGNNQGLNKLLAPAGMAAGPSVTPIAIEKETPVSCLLNAHQQPGMVALNAAVDTAMDKAASGGMATVGVYNTRSSSGMLAYYGNKIGTAGLIGIIAAVSPESTAVSKGARKTLGTNPILSLIHI
eukprot:TRINITY_DN21409_c0_g1_i1.p1 TRINITY_DN21409_c0_g1~~TRINITY_DN21409_c0_g1_i1.p1  ORF type:complete len:156 (-),score=57.08 TRINITY_DN21409_c0_g1_i1:45-491(-)